MANKYLEYGYDNLWYNLLNYAIGYRTDEVKLQKLSRIAEYLVDNPDEFGDVMLTETMIDLVSKGFITDYDGVAHLCNYDTFDEAVCASVEDIENLNKFKDNYFILWYNK